MRDELTLRASDKEEAPESPISLLKAKAQKSRTNKKVIKLKHQSSILWEMNWLSMPLIMKMLHWHQCDSAKNEREDYKTDYWETFKYNKVRDELTLRTSDKQETPESPISFCKE